jgi:hypothetical protein
VERYFITEQSTEQHRFYEANACAWLIPTCKLAIMCSAHRGAVTLLVLN